MGTFHTTLGLVNFSGKNIKATRVTGVDDYDWGGNNRPDKNFAGALPDGSSRCKRAEVTSGVNGAWFSFGVTFDDKTTIDFKVNQQDAYDKHFRTYAQPDRNVVIPQANAHLEVFQATGRDGNDDADGATWTNAFYIRPKIAPDNSGWMGALRAAKLGVKFNQITMPGSHDAGMYTGTNDQCDTQSRTIGEQLTAGSRYFDIRIYLSGTTLTTYHANTDGGTLSDILDDVVDFMHAHPSETVFLKFRTYRTADQQPTIDLVKSKLAGLLLLDPGGQTIATRTLDSLKNKVVTAFRVTTPDFDGYDESRMDPTNGVHRYLDYANENTGAFIRHPGSGSLGVYDSYTNVNDYVTMHDDQWKKFRAYGGSGHNYLFLLSWTLTGKPAKLLDLELLSRTANPRLPAQLRMMAKDPAAEPRGLPNIVYLDYVDPWLCRSVIAMNGI